MGSHRASSSPTTCFGTTQLVHLAHYLPRCVDALPGAERPSARRVSANEPIARPIGGQLIGVLLARLGKAALLVRMLAIRNARVRLPERTSIDDRPITVVPAVAGGTFELHFGSGKPVPLENPLYCGDCGLIVAEAPGKFEFAQDERG